MSRGTISCRREQTGQELYSGPGGSRLRSCLRPTPLAIYSIYHLHKQEELNKNKQHQPKHTICIHTGLKTMSMDSGWGDLHNVGCHSTARNQDHHSRLDLVIRVEQPFECQVHQDPSHYPDAQDGQQGTKDLQGFKHTDTHTQRICESP